jgi:hypothetical protein
MPDTVQTDPARAPDIDNAHLPPFAEIAGRQSAIRRQTEGEVEWDGGANHGAIDLNIRHGHFARTKQIPDDEGVADIAGRHASEAPRVGARPQFHAVVGRHPWSPMLASLIDQFLEMFISVDSCPAAPFSVNEAPHFSAILSRISRHLPNLLDKLPLS